MRTPRIWCRVSSRALSIRPFSVILNPPEARFELTCAPASIVSWRRKTRPRGGSSAAADSWWFLSTSMAPNASWPWPRQPSRTASRKSGSAACSSWRSPRCERCQAEGRQLQFCVFERYDLTEDRITYDQLAREFGVAPSAITNYLAAMRRDLRRIVLENLRAITSSDREFRREARAVLGIEI